MKLLIGWIFDEIELKLPSREKANSFGACNLKREEVIISILTNFSPSLF